MHKHDEDEDLIVEPMNEILDVDPPVRINDNPWMPFGCAKMLIIAKSGGGKTTLIVNLISKGWLKYDKLWLWSGSLEEDEEYPALIEGFQLKGHEVIRAPKDSSESDESDDSDIDPEEDDSRIAQIMKNVPVSDDYRSANVIVSDTLDNFPTCKIIKNSVAPENRSKAKHLVVIDDFGTDKFVGSIEFATFLNKCRHSNIQIVVVQHTFTNVMKHTRDKFLQFCLFNGALQGPAAIRHAHDYIDNSFKQSCSVDYTILHRAKSMVFSTLTKRNLTLEKDIGKVLVSCSIKVYLSRYEVLFFEESQIYSPSRRRSLQLNNGLPLPIFLNLFFCPFEIGQALCC